MASTHDGTVTLTASARYGYGGKQFVARIEGRDPKYTFERTFLGRKASGANRRPPLLTSPASTWNATSTARAARPTATT
jgi:hypothetical protein